MILASNGIIAGKGGIVFDIDAEAFITAAGITDNTQKTAINTLVVDLKANSIYNKFKAIYPFVGGTASSHKFNLKDPRDLDAAYRLSFVGGGTHSATGYLPNGTTAYADTFLVPSTSGILLNSTHISYYSRTNTNSGVDIASQYITGDAGMTYLWVRDSGSSYSRINSLGNDYVQTNTDGKGMYIVSRIISGNFDFYRNATKTTINTTSSALPVRSIEIGSLNSNSARTFGNKECAFSSIGDGLTDSEATALYNAVQTFNTTLSRQV